MLKIRNHRRSLWTDDNEGSMNFRRRRKFLRICPTLAPNKPATNWAEFSRQFVDEPDIFRVPLDHSRLSLEFLHYFLLRRHCYLHRYYFPLLLLPIRSSLDSVHSWMRNIQKQSALIRRRIERTKSPSISRIYAKAKPLFFSFFLFCPAIGSI